MYNTFGVRGGKFSSANPKSEVDWLVHYAKSVPGPGEYGNPRDTLEQKTRPGGRFSVAKPKTDVEWAIYRAKFVPGPGQYYNTKSVDSECKGGRFNMSSSKNDIEWKVHYAAQMPGPGQYDVPLSEKRAGGRFSTSKPKSDVDWAIIRGGELPGPGEYDTNKTETRSGGRWGTSVAKSDVDWAILRASKIPGPADYAGKVDEAVKLPGGRFSVSKPKSDVEWAIARAAGIPGPGEYNTDLTSISSRTRSPSRPMSSRENSRYSVGSSPPRAHSSLGSISARSNNMSRERGRDRSVDRTLTPPRSPQKQKSIVSVMQSATPVKVLSIPPPKKKKGKSIGIQTDEKEEETEGEGEGEGEGSPNARSAERGRGASPERGRGGSRSPERGRERSPERAGSRGEKRLDVSLSDITPAKPSGRSKLLFGDHIYSSGSRRNPGKIRARKPNGEHGRGNYGGNFENIFAVSFDTKTIDSLLERTRPTASPVPADLLSDSQNSADSRTRESILPDVTQSQSWWTFEPLFGVPLQDKFATRKNGRGKMQQRDPFTLSKSMMGDLELEMKKSMIQKSKPSVVSIYSSLPWN